MSDETPNLAEIRQRKIYGYLEEKWQAEKEINVILQRLCEILPLYCYLQLEVQEHRLNSGQRLLTISLPIMI